MPEPPRPPAALSTAPATPPAATIAGEGVVYIDAAGRCTFADHGARALLHWNGGERTLSDLFAGGTRESAALLNELALQGSVDAYPTALAGPTAAAVEVSGVALRDRHDKFWGAALLIHRRGFAQKP